MMSGQALQDGNREDDIQREIAQYIIGEYKFTPKNNPNAALYELAKAPIMRTTGHVIYFTSRFSDLFNNPSMNIIDVCGGTGLEAGYFVRKTNGYVVNLDKDSDMIRASRERARRNGLSNMMHIVGDRDNLPFKEGAFDLLTCYLGIYDNDVVFETDAEGDQYMRSKFSDFQRILADGATIVITRHIKDENLPALSRAQLESDKRCMEESGLVDAGLRILRTPEMRAATLLTYGKVSE